MMNVHLHDMRNKNKNKKITESRKKTESVYITDQQLYFLTEENTTRLQSYHAPSEVGCSGFCFLFLCMSTHLKKINGSFKEMK